MKAKTFERIVASLMIVVLSLSFIVNGVAIIPEECVVIGAYYYIWWGMPFNNHWEQGVKYTSFLGEYNSSDPLTADRHILWAKQHGIDFFAVSWLGNGIWIDWDFDDIDWNLKNGLLGASHLQNFNFCLFYESDIVLNAALQAGENLTSIFMNDMIYAAENYFDNPSYLRIDDRPVMFIYNLRFIYDTLNTTVAQGLFDDLLQRMSVYFVGDVGSGPSPPNADSPLLYSMDAVTSYFFAHVYTSEGWENVTECAKRYYPEWRSVMNSNGTRFIPNAYPGYDNTEYCKWKNDSSKPIVLPLNETMFKEMLTIALDYANDDLKIIMITSWNEWLESTAIEPSMEFGELFLHTVLNARRIQQPCSIICAVFYFAVGAASGVVVIIILCYKKSLRKIK